MGSGITSNSGNYDSIAVFFQKHAKDDLAVLEKRFENEYPGRSFKNYKKKYFEEYGLNQPRTSKCGENCWHEVDFKDHVIRKLEDQGYTENKDMQFANNSGDLRLYPDIIMQKAGTTFIFEVKGCYHCHRIQTGIGQLVYYNFLDKHSSNNKYILVFPENSKNASDFENGFTEYTASHLGIDIWFL